MTKSASNPYLELCFHLDGSHNVYLRVPTVWDDINKRWIAFIKTPQTQKLIHAEAKNSFDLQNSFNKEMLEILSKEDEISKEVFSMFQPLSYWDEQQ